MESKTDSTQLICDVANCLSPTQRNFVKLVKGSTAGWPASLKNPTAGALQRHGIVEPKYAGRGLYCWTLTEFGTKLAATTGDWD
jgi:hypothetical protein